MHQKHSSLMRASTYVSVPAPGQVRAHICVGVHMYPYTCTYVRLFLCMCMMQPAFIAPDSMYIHVAIGKQMKVEPSNDKQDSQALQGCNAWGCKEISHVSFRL